MKDCSALLFSTRMEQKINAYKILVGKREEEGLLGITRRRWDVNIIKDFRELGWKSVD